MNNNRHEHLRSMSIKTLYKTSIAEYNSEGHHRKIREDSTPHITIPTRARGEYLSDKIYISNSNIGYSGPSILIICIIIGMSLSYSAKTINF